MTPKIKLLAVGGIMLSALLMQTGCSSQKPEPTAEEIQYQKINEARLTAAEDAAARAQARADEAYRKADETALGVSRIKEFKSK